MTISALKMANSIISRQANRIAELEKERDDFHDSLVTAELLVSDYRIDNAELEKENKKMLSCLFEISNECIGEIAMSYKLDAQMIGESIYQATGKTNPEIAKALKDNN